MSVYEILGVSCTDDDETIKKAYKRLAAMNHPDHGGDPDRMAQINQAYAKIDTPEKRKAYDTHNAFAMDAKMWEHCFGKSSVAADFGKKPTDSVKSIDGTDIVLNVNIPMETFCYGYNGMELKFTRETTCLACSGTGAEKSVACNRCGGVGYTTYRRRKSKCKDCNGSGVKVVESCEVCAGTGVRKKPSTYILPVYQKFTEHLTIKGKGNEGMYGGKNGDLIVNFLPQPLENYHWSTEEHKIICDDVKVNIEDLVLGCAVRVKIGYIGRDILVAPYPKGNVAEGSWCGCPVKLNLVVNEENDLTVFEEIRNNRKKK